MRTAGLFTAILITPVPAAAQVGPAFPLTDTAPGSASGVMPGQTSGSSVGQVGRRQTRDEAAPNIQPMGRIDSRIANRVELRLRTRIDRYYDPQANTVSSFKIAGEQARRPGKSGRR